jgi:hypothetical protein
LAWRLDLSGPRPTFNQQLGLVHEVGLVCDSESTMHHEFHFTFANLERQLNCALSAGYSFLTCEQYLRRKRDASLPVKALVNRVDVDFSCKKAARLVDIFNRIGVQGTFFVRLHAPEYNPFSFENYLVLKDIRDAGHEIGYHSEIVDQSAIWNEDAAECLRRDVAVLARMLDVEIKGVASHGGLTGLNNLDFWKENSPLDFGLLYEAYEKSETFSLFDDSFYISDSEWTRWKCYDHGVRVENDARSLAEHLSSAHRLIYLLTHPDTYFDRHIYE